MRFIILSLAVLGTLSCAAAWGDKLKHDSPNNQPISSEESVESEEIDVVDFVDTVERTAIITGMVRIFGNEPHTYVGIVDEGGTEYAVYPRSVEDELRKLQGRLIVFTVTVLAEPKGEGGMYLKGGTVTPLTWEIIR